MVARRLLLSERCRSLQTDLHVRLEDAMEQGRSIALLRDLRAFEAIDMAKFFIDAGISMIEVPLNSPNGASRIKAEETV